MPNNFPVPMDDWINNPLFLIDYDQVDENSWGYVIRRFDNPDKMMAFQEDPATTEVPIVGWGRTAKEALKNATKTVGHTIRVAGDGVVDFLVDDEIIAEQVAGKKKQKEKSTDDLYKEMFNRMNKIDPPKPKRKYTRRKKKTDE
jgi:hypothetical protein